MNPTPEHPIEEQLFKARLARFVEFVEKEASRIDEERRGLHRRDGGRVLSCTIFLSELERFLLKDFVSITTLRKKIEGMKKNTKTEFEVGSEMSTPRIIRDNGYNQALDDILALLPTNTDTTLDIAKKELDKHREELENMENG